MSNTDLWMPLYIGDYLGDTGHLDATGHGAYLLLLMHYWRNGPLPDDDKQLAVIARMERKVWIKEVAPLVRKFFTAQGGFLHQKRLDNERGIALEKSAKRKAAGSLGGTAKRERIGAAKQGQNRSGDPSDDDEGNSGNGADLPQNDARTAQNGQEPASAHRQQDGSKCPSNATGDATHFATANGVANGVANDKQRGRQRARTESLSNQVSKQDSAGPCLVPLREPSPAPPDPAPPVPIMPPRNSPPGQWMHLANAREVDEKGVCHPVRGGYYLDVVCELICQEARINDAGWKGDWRPVIAWLDAGYDSDQIVTAVRHVAARPSYSPPRTLQYFDKAVREGSVPASPQERRNRATEH